jgi:hypothetical protein
MQVPRTLVLTCVLDPTLSTELIRVWLSDLDGQLRPPTIAVRRGDGDLREVVRGS